MNFIWRMNKEFEKGKIMATSRAWKQSNLFKIYSGILRLPCIVLFSGCFLYSCNSKKQNTVSDFDAYPFDSSIIKKLPAYDSLANTIIKNFDLFKKDIKENDSYKAYRYQPYSDGDDVQKQLPADATLIKEKFLLLGKGNINGFDLFRDSTIKIYIKNTFSEKYQLYIEENLSYFPKGGIIMHRKFPDKDTILNANWQYWIRFSKPELF